jgi:deazaflavin-dependent oxidoreductase (nitroreductase family)
MAVPTNGLIIKSYSTLHRLWYRITGGAVGGTFSGMPILLLTTTGRRSGKQRTTPLMYMQDGDRMVVVASNAGRDEHPRWWLNLKQHPRATVQIKSKQTAVHAADASAEERSRLWPRLTAAYADYETYEQRTNRPIAVVLLTPEQSETA